MEFLTDPNGLTAIFILITSIVGSLALVVEGLSGLAKLTKTEKDDAILNKISKVLSTVAGGLDKITPVSRTKPDGK